MKELIKESYATIIVLTMYLTIIPTCALVIWETMTGNSWIDILFDWLKRKGDKNGKSDKRSD